MQQHMKTAHRQIEVGRAHEQDNFLLPQDSGGLGEGRAAAEAPDEVCGSAAQALQPAQGAWAGLPAASTFDSQPSRPAGWAHMDDGVWHPAASRVHFVGARSKMMGRSRDM